MSVAVLPQMDKAITADTSPSANSVVLRDSGGGVTHASVATDAAAINGNLSVTGASKTGAYSLTSTETVILCDASGGAFTVTLPLASAASGRLYVVKNIGATGTVTVGVSGTDTIDGASTDALASQWDAVRLWSNGNNWFKV